MRWFRSLLAVCALLMGTNAGAVIPVSQYKYHFNNNGPLAGYTYYPEIQQACDAALQYSKTVSHPQFASRTWTQVYCRLSGGTDGAQWSLNPSPGYNIGQSIVRTTPGVCPANSTAVSGGCQCAAGYQENAAKTACEVGASEAEKFCQSMLGFTINTGGTGSIPVASCHMPEPPFDAPEQAKGCGVTIGDAVKFPDDTGAIRWSGVGKFGGGTCTPGASPGLPPVESKDDKCPGGFAGTVNGEQKCIPAEPDKGIEGVKSSSSTDASGTKKDVKEETKCEGQKCTTTTTTTTTTSSGSTSTTTEKKEEAITDKCQKDPTNAVCQKTNGGMGGKVSDSSCAVNPSAKGCGGAGAAIGELYTGKGVTVQSILDQAVTDLKGSGIGGAVGGFFTVSGGGSCPPLVWNVSYVNATVSLPSLCSDTANTIYAVLQGVLLVVAGFVAFRVAIDN